jgi:hypothetical protein
MHLGSSNGRRCKRFASALLLTFAAVIYFREHKKLWTVVLCMQVIGAICAPFANVHLNPLAMIGGIFLLAPGSFIAAAILSPETLEWSWIGMAVACNLVFWFAVSVIISKWKNR